MNEYTYINIFDTKGIEYLVIIAFLVLLIPFWLYLNSTVNFTNKIRKAVVSLSGRIKQIPHGLFHAGNHTWTHLEKSGSAKVGLNNLILNITGSIKLDFAVEENQNIRKGELLARIRHEGKQLNVYSPISGQILLRNFRLEGNSDLINQDPYGNGWICSIKPEDWKKETYSYYLAEEATLWLKDEVQRIRDFLAERSEKSSPGLASLILQDGGELSSEVLAEMSEEIWNDFQKEFMDPL